MFKPNPHCKSPRLAQQLATALLSFTVLVGLQACGTLAPAGFEIVGEGAAFTDRSYILSRNNRISNKGAEGRVFRGPEGLYANPAFINGSWFLLVDNVTDADGENMASNRLNNIIGLVILADEQRLVIEPSDYDYHKEGLLRPTASRSQKSRRSRSAQINRETATFQLSEDQFISVINAENLEVTVVGSGRRMIFGARNMAPNFQSNLFDFYHAAKVDEASRP